MKYLILMVVFLMGCEDVKLVGDVFAKIYPKDGYADAAKVLTQDPVKVSDPVEIPLADMSGWICVPEAQFAKYRRAYEKGQQKALAEVQLKLEEKRARE